METYRGPNTEGTATAVGIMGGYGPDHATPRTLITELLPNDAGGGFTAGVGNRVWEAYYDQGVQVRVTFRLREGQRVRMTNAILAYYLAVALGHRERLEIAPRDGGSTINTPHFDLSSMAFGHPRPPLRLLKKNL